MVGDHPTRAPSLRWSAAWWLVLHLATPPSAHLVAAQPAAPHPAAGETVGEDIDFLKQLVDIGSDTAQTDAVDACQKLVAKRLEQLGFNVVLTPQPSANVKTGSLLVAERSGARPRFITLLLHTDTVFPASSGFSGFKREGIRAVGPGVIDAKGGVVVALRAVQEILNAAPHTGYSLRVVVSPAEEIGSTGFLETFAKLSQDTDYLLGFEPALDNGSIISSRRGNRWYEIHVEGIEAHAGRNHKSGANACHELAIKIDRLQRLTNYDKEVSINIGHMEGGKDKYAVVCGSARAKLDVRFSDPATRASTLAKIDRILGTTFVRSHDGNVPTRTAYAIVDDPHPFALEKQSLPAVRKLVDLIGTYEHRTISHARSGGSGDSNFFYRPGMVIIDGLGPVGGNMHRNDEFIDLPTIGTRAHAVAEFVKSLL